MTNENSVLPTPAEQLPITLFDAVVLAARADDGTIYLAIRDVCQALAVDFSTQLRRIRNHAVLAEGLARFRIATSGGVQAQDFLELERVPTWLLMINAARVGEPVRPRLLWLQRYIVREVYRSFATLAGLPEDASRQIEDLVDLQRFNSAITELADHQESLEARQGALETSQDQARQAWRDLRAEIRAIAQRIATIEQHVGGVISREQRGYLYQLVQAWGAAKATREPRLSKAAAYAACWTLLKAKYRIARYEDLPAAKYADCIAFVRQSYQALTGEDLNLPEQGTLDLGDALTDNPPAIDAQIGQRLRAARTAAQLTLRQLAARLGWPYTTLANYEEGRRPLRIAQLVAIAAALGRSSAAFLVDLPEAAAVIERIDGDLDRCLQVAFILDSLDSEAEITDDTLM